MIDFSFEKTETFVGEVLAYYAEHHPDAIALESDRLQISYQELDRLVTNYQNALIRAKLPENACVGLHFKHQVTYLIVHLALLKLGITQVSIDWMEPEALQVDKAKLLGVDLIIHDDKTSLDSFECMVLNLEDLSGSNFTDLECQPKCYPSESVLLIFGSGTTGRPKCFGFNSIQYAQMLKRSVQGLVVGYQERLFSYTTMQYPSPKRYALAAFSQGACLVFSHRPIRDLVVFVKERKLSHLDLTPNQAQQFLLKSPLLKKLVKGQVALPELKSLQLSSSLIKQELKERLLEKITPNLYIRYATNEFGPVSLALPHEVASIPGTVGKVIPEVKVEISGDSVGNVILHGCSLIDSYVNNSEATQKSFAREGWYQPNDIGYFTDDGHLVIEGRSDDVMIFKGTNIYPRPLEELLESHSAVVEAAVFPVTIGELENVPIGVVTLAFPIHPKELVLYCNERVGWRRPQHIFVIDKLPRNAEEKVLKRKLAEMIRSKIKRNR